MKKNLFIIAFLLVFNCNISYAAQVLPENIKNITVTIEAPLSGEKGKNFFVCPYGFKCSTEEFVKIYYQNKGYKVMRGEVFFWQGMFALAFYEEIFSINTDNINDIPIDLFSDDFYSNRKKIMDKKYKYLKTANLYNYINAQLQKHEHTDTRLLKDAPIEQSDNCVEFFKTPIVQEFLTRIKPEIFALIVHRIALNPNFNRAGTPDLVIWNDKEMIFVEVKREKEILREKQILWLEYLIKNKVPSSVTRVKGIKYNLN